MGLSITETTKEVDLNLPDDLPDAIAEDIKKDVGQYVVDAILENVGSGRSPVSGYGQFKQLSKPYAEHDKGGRRLPNLDLEGSMLDALTFKETDLGIEVGIWNDEQAAKSYGHNSGFKGHPTLEGVAPMRRFIPDESEDFRKDIQSEIKRIVSERVDDWKAERGTETPTKNEVNLVADRRSSAEINASLDEQSSSISSFLGESTLSRLVRDMLKREA